MPDNILSLGSSIGSSLQSPSFDLTQKDSRQDDPAHIHHAAQDFESLLISQILKSAHSDSEGWLGTGDEEAGSTAMTMAEEQLAQAMSARGGLGLSSLIEKGLTKSKNETDQ